MLFRSALNRALTTYRRAYAMAYVSQREQMTAIHSGVLHDMVVNALEEHDLTAARNALGKDIGAVEMDWLG